MTGISARAPGALRRREMLAGMASLTVAGAARAAPSPAFDVVRRAAQDLAARPYQPPSRVLPPALERLSYDGYRDLRFRPDHAIWRAEGLPFQLQMFHRGGLFREPVEIFEAVGPDIRPIPYSAALFDFGKQRLGELPPDLGFAGFRIHNQMNRRGVWDEVAAFLGASYFRAVAAGGVYGLSARGLALGAGEPGEEFPVFRRFYIERPAKGARALVVHALLDGPSVAGAYRFEIAPGRTTAFDVQASLFPRTPLKAPGIAPLTSMYFFGPDQPPKFDDFRPQVHDSDGLLIARADGSRLWRPLVNPDRVQLSAFAEAGLRGFGLMQREQRFEAYQDLETDYHQRPSAWVEPLEGFGPGSVRLAELPAQTEAEDNIVASWRPDRPLEPGREHRFRYRLGWGADPAPAAKLARVIQWRGGRGDQAGRRRFVIDFGPFDARAFKGLTPQVTASAGGITHMDVQPNAYLGGARLSFELDPGRGAVCDLRATLVQGTTTVTEAWVHRWLS